MPPGSNGSQTDAVNPYASIAGGGGANDAGNAWGHSDAVAFEDYGQNSAGPWSDGIGDQVYDFGTSDEGEHVVNVVDAAPFSYAQLTLVDGGPAGETGPLGGTTPGENPLA